MKRTVNGDRTPRIDPVEKVELSEKHFNVRILFFILFTVIAIAAIVYSINSLITKESGWREITAGSDLGVTSGSEFKFNYYLGASGASATVEYKRISKLYTGAMRKSYELFNIMEDFEGIKNLKYINDHPNEEIEVDEMLYQAFELISDTGSRFPYGGPIYYSYQELFNCENDYQITEYDPTRNPEVAEFYAKVAEFANDPASVNVEVLGNGKIKLCVSEEYLKYTKENDVTVLVDFFWMKNGFVADYVADLMTENGYTRGTISSYDGFTRNLDTSGTDYTFNIFDRYENSIGIAAKMHYARPMSIVFLRDYPLGSADKWHYYETEQGDIITPYVDIASDPGYSKSSVSDLVSYSGTKECARIALEMIPIYIADEFREEALAGLAADGINSVWCVSVSTETESETGKETGTETETGAQTEIEIEIRYNDKDIVFSDVYSGAIRYKTKLVG